MSDDVLLEAGAAAEMVGVSASGLRRLAPIYEAVHGELPRKPKSNNRLWSQVAVERLQRARGLVDLERYRTISDALTALARGVDVNEVELAPTAARANPDDTQKALELLTLEVRALRQEVAGLKALPAPAANRQPDESQAHGLMVRAAIRLETWLKRFRQ